MNKTEIKLANWGLPHPFPEIITLGYIHSHKSMRESLVGELFLVSGFIWDLKTTGKGGLIGFMSDDNEDLVYSDISKNALLCLEDVQTDVAEWAFNGCRDQEPVIIVGRIREIPEEEIIPTIDVRFFFWSLHDVFPELSDMVKTKDRRFSDQEAKFYSR